MQGEFCSFQLDEFTIALCVKWTQKHTVIITILVLDKSKKLKKEKP